MSLPDITLILSLQLAGAVLVAIVARRVGIPLTVVLVVAGFVVGSLTRLETPVEGEQITDIIVFLFLPVLVYEAAISLDPRSFVRNIRAILVLAIPAVVVASILIGMTLHFGFGMALATALLFGVLISATDPVAVMAIFRDLGVPQRLLTIVEGESLFNDGVAIVLFNIVLIAALGGSVSVTKGMLEFIEVFLGGLAIGILIGLAVAVVLPWLDRLPAAALSVAAAYGSFALSEHLLGFSGVMATVAVGQTIAGLAPSRASSEVRQIWHETWEALAFVANALLFLLIGAAIDSQLLLSNLGMIGTAIVVVLAARVLAVLPLVSALERLSKIPTLDIRSQAVLIWGGLRGGVALALALSLPEALAERDLLIAMTGGVVLATLVINATTISFVINRLGLGEMRRIDRVLAGGAALSGLAIARDRLDVLGLHNAAVSAEIEHAESVLNDELLSIALTDDEERQLVILRGLNVERETFLHLHDVGLIQPSVTRKLLNDIDDQMSRVRMGIDAGKALERGPHAGFDRVVDRALRFLPDPDHQWPIDLTYEEATARHIAANRANRALDLLAHLPNISDAAISGARVLFSRWEAAAIAELTNNDAKRFDLEVQRWRQALAVSQLASSEELNRLVSVGLVSEIVANHAEQRIANEVKGGDGLTLGNSSSWVRQPAEGMQVVTMTFRKIGYVHQVHHDDDLVASVVTRYGRLGWRRKQFSVDVIHFVTYDAVILKIERTEFHFGPDLVADSELDDL